jgi:hypothetical protein
MKFNLKNLKINVNGRKWVNEQQKVDEEASEKTQRNYG